MTNVYRYLGVDCSVSSIGTSTVIEFTLDGERVGYWYGGHTMNDPQSYFELDGLDKQTAFECVQYWKQRNGK